MTSVVARFNAPICKYHVDIMYPQFSISDFDAVALGLPANDKTSKRSFETGIVICVRGESGV